MTEQIPTEINKELVEYCRKNFANLPKTIEYDKMISSVPYDCYNEELALARTLVNERALDYQNLRVKDFDYDMDKYAKARADFLKTIFGKAEDCWIEAPFFVDYGCNIEFGDHCYCNFGCTFLDCTLIKIGAKTMFAPNCTITTADHPSDPVPRSKGVEYAKPVIIGSNCWFGAHAVVLAGVTIGDNVVIGSGAVVNKDIPSNCVAVGVPAKVIKTFDPSAKEDIIKEVG